MKKVWIWILFFIILFSTIFYINISLHGLETFLKIGMYLSTIGIIAIIFFGTILKVWEK